MHLLTSKIKCYLQSGDHVGCSGSWRNKIQDSNVHNNPKYTGSTNLVIDYNGGGSNGSGSNGKTGVYYVTYDCSENFTIDISNIDNTDTRDVSKIVTMIFDVSGNGQPVWGNSILINGNNVASSTSFFNYETEPEFSDVSMITQSIAIIYLGGETPKRVLSTITPFYYYAQTQ